MCIDLESSIQPAQKDFQYLNKKKKEAKQNLIYNDKRHAFGNQNLKNTA